MKKYDLIVCGGTFDLLHEGHKKFLQDILNQTNKVLLGITSDAYVSKFKNDPSASSGQEQVEKFEIRKRAVLNFIGSIGVGDRFEVISIDKPEEPLLENKYQPEAIAVTPQTEQTAIEINKKRKELGLQELEIIVIPMEKAGDGGLISSTRIRNGEINRDGRLYVRPEWKNKTLKLPQSLRSTLQKPLGKLLKSIPSGLDSEKTITIGDITTQKFNEKRLGQFLSIIDFAVHRQKKFEKLSDLGFAEDIETIAAENPAGSITPELFDSVKKAFSSDNRKIILIKGEEDLAVLPVLLISPLGFVIYYGQPNEGLVEVLVTEENKEKVFELVSKFT